MARLVATNWEEIWSHEEYQVYGSLIVQTTGSGNQWISLGVCVGVRPSQQSTAQAAGGVTRGLLDAWFADSSDWDSAPHTFRRGTEKTVARLALEAIRGNLEAIYADAREELGE